MQDMTEVETKGDANTLAEAEMMRVAKKESAVREVEIQRNSKEMEERTIQSRRILNLLIKQCIQRKILAEERLRGVVHSSKLVLWYISCKPLNNLCPS
jgi:D-ribose pyranose/furanose isomerase RbsD